LKTSFRDFRRPRLPVEGGHRSDAQALPTADRAAIESGRRRGEKSGRPAFSAAAALRRENPAFFAQVGAGALPARTAATAQVAPDVNQTGPARRFSAPADRTTRTAADALPSILR